MNRDRGSLGQFLSDTPPPGFESGWTVPYGVSHLGVREVQRARARAEAKIGGAKAWTLRSNRPGTGTVAGTLQSGRLRFCIRLLGLGRRASEPRICAWN